MSEEIAVVEEKTDVSRDLPWNVLAVNTDAEKLKVFAAMRTPEMLKDHDDETLEIIGWNVSYGKRTNRATGETEVCINTTLFDKDLKAYFTQSNGVAAAMWDLREWFPDGPAKVKGGVIKLKTTKVKMRNGNEMRTLIPVFE